MAGDPKRQKGAFTPAGILVALLSVSLVMIIFELPTFLMVLFGLAPTWAALLTDRSHAKTRTVAIGTFNLAGAAPFFVKIWSEGNHLGVALEVLSEPLTWLSMYGAAGVSLGLSWVAPSMSALVLEFTASAKESRLERKQEEIIENWGEEVRQDAQALMVKHGYLRPARPGKARPE
jgi:hypothetical protein